MKKVFLLLVVAALISGCAKFQHAESIDIDRFGATGQYQDSRSGKLYMATIAAGGGGGGAGPLGGCGHGGMGLGGFGLRVISNQGQSDPTNFAKAIAMIDMSKKLKTVKYDEVTGIREYELVNPLAPSETERHTNPPPSFGRQPVQ